MKYHGKASHAAAYPWEGVNALDAAVLAYNNISALRQQLRPEWRLHGEAQAERASKRVYVQAFTADKSLTCSERWKREPQLKGIPSFQLGRGAAKS